ncbi:FG-GAP-like repeat-containing protein [Streptomyces gamaensis]|uniref:FG-GAP-like repeat-containing protein n=1 Tax=Streptomyces gamaensis TaxID=1763542 RepID=A0ABW0YSZ0_9ACTN
MPAKNPRIACAIGFLAAAVTGSLLTAGPANALQGPTAKDGSYPFVAQLKLVDEKAVGRPERGCSAALVAQQWLITAASCFADDLSQGFKVAPGAPKFKTTATIGSADLVHNRGTVVDVVELVPREDRDLVLAKLANPVSGIAPIAVTTNTVLDGEKVWAAGFGRTADEWVPDKLHYAEFSVSGVNPTGSMRLNGTTPNATMCQGDSGAPAFRSTGGKFELVGVTSRSRQGGCLGNEKESRRDVIDSRADDIADWVTKQTVPDTPLGDYRVDINGDGKADYVIVHDDSSVEAWGNNGGDGRGDWIGYGCIADGVPNTPGTNVRFADINGDGKADYLVIGDNGSVRAWVNKGVENNRHLGWINYGTIAGGTGGPARKVRFADINGDRKADYLVVEDNGAVHAWVQNGDGHDNWVDYGVIATGGLGNDVRFADIDGDGNADYLVVGNNGSVRAWRNNGAGDAKGGWTDYGQIAGGTGSSGSQVRFADIDGDGKADYVVINADHSINAWINKVRYQHDDWMGYGRIATGTNNPNHTVRI